MDWFIPAHYCALGLCWTRGCTDPGEKGRANLVCARSGLCWQLREGPDKSKQELERGAEGGKGRKQISKVWRPENSGQKPKVRLLGIGRALPIWTLS